MNAKKKGGRYIGQGSYGCVFGEPPLRCKGEKRSTRKVISKLLYIDDAVDEYNESSIWTRIDPKNEFSLSALHKCRFDPSLVESSDETDKCNTEYIKPVLSGYDPGTLIFYPYGGKDLSKLKPKSTEYIHIIYGLYKLFGGLIIAHKNGVAHLDIKEPNIVCDISNDSATLRLIDFGLSIDTLSVVSASKLNIYTVQYLYWPFELNVFNPSISDHTTLESRYVEFYKTVRHYPKYFPARSYLQESGEPYPLSQFKDYIDAAKKFSITKLLTQADVYSVGLVLTKTVYNMFHHRIDEKNNILVDGVSNPSDWHKNVLKHITGPILHLAMKMVERDPSRRITMTLAKKELKKVIPKLTKYLLPNDVAIGLRGMNILGVEPTYKTIVTPLLPLTPSLKAANIDKLFNTLKPYKSTKKSHSRKKKTAESSGSIFNLSL